MKSKINRLTIHLVVLFFFINCKSQQLTERQQKSNGEREIAFKEYLVKNKIPFKELSDTIFDTYYSGFLDDEKKQKLEKNQNLKINKVYVRYRTPYSVEFSIYSDKGTLCLSTIDLDIDGKMLSFPENGVIKVLKPIIVEDFGDFEIFDDVIKTRKRRVSPYNEIYHYVNGTVKKDTIHFTEKYIGKEMKFEKKMFAKTYKDDFIEVYQPNLKAVQYKTGKFLVSYEVTGEFNIQR
ncbi:hypothetical protein [Kaistella jeonii]|nr:hypothetical protein [Kaistella jeonii]